MTAVVVLFGAGCSGSTNKPAPAVTTGHVLEAPPIFTSKAGELHLRVKAESTTSTINGRSYKNMSVYRESVVGGAGTFTPGTASAYVAPEWHVMPGDRLVLDYINALPDLPFAPVGSKTPEMVAQPLNLHTHGLTVRPAGNGDNVLMSIPPGRSNRFTIDIPKDQHAGLYWYHPHIHGLSDDQVYAGLAGHIVVGRADGDYREFDGLTERPMMIRYNVGAPGPKGDLIDASPFDTAGTAMPPRGKMIYTVNGRVSPRIPIAAADPTKGTPAESQVWAFTNITGSASYILSMDEVDAKDATNAAVVGRPLPLTIVSIDGTAMPAPQVLDGDPVQRSYLLGQGGRVAILAQGASDPSKVVRLLQVENRSGSGEASASDWPEQKLIGGYRDYTGTVLAFGSGSPSASAKHVETPAHLTTNLPSATHELDTQPVANKRTFVFNDVSKPSSDTPNEFGVDFALFPDVPIAQPKIGTVEEWTILNYSSLHHPFHLHTQYSQVMEVDAPINPDYKGSPGQYPSLQYVTNMSEPSPADYQQDVINLPPAKVGPDGMPELGPDGVPVAPGKIVLRTKIDDYLGTYVEHCHRLPHEDRGMMSMVRSIPHDPIVAVSRTGAGGSAIDVVRTSDGKVAATIPASPGSTGALAAAVGDVDGDTVPDVAVASLAGPDAVTIYSGASGWKDVIRTAHPFDGSASVGSLALGDLNGDGHDDLVAGQSNGGSRVVVIDGANGNRLSDFSAYGPDSRGGVSVATGILELGGRVSVITGAGPGGPPTVNVYNFDLFGDKDGNEPDLGATGALKPLEVASFNGADPGYTGGVQVSTGYPFARTGGFAAVLVAPLSGPAVLRTFTEDSMMEHHMVSASGVFMPDEYVPGGSRSMVPGPMLDLRADPAFGSGAQAAFVSTIEGADVVAAPATGGAVQRWTVGADKTFTAAGPLAASGVAPSAM